MSIRLGFVEIKARYYPYFSIHREIIRLEVNH